VTDFFEIDFWGHTTWETAKVIPQNRYDFTVNFGYLQAHNAIPYWAEPLEYNYKEYPSNKTEPTFSITQDNSILHNKAAITIASMMSKQKTNLREQLPPELHKYLLLFHPNQAAKLPEH
jgi:hypothetical protein